jgi:hypothetical protein
MLTTFTPLPNFFQGLEDHSTDLRDKRDEAIKVLVDMPVIDEGRLSSPWSRYLHDEVTPLIRAHSVALFYNRRLNYRRT